jgi:chromosome segregation ATPase
MAIEKEDVEQIIKIRDSMDESNKIVRNFYETLEDTFDLAKKLNRAYGETYDKLNKAQQELKGIDAEILSHIRQIESNNTQISALTAQIAEDEKEIAQLARQELSLTAQISEIKAEIADIVRQEKEIGSALNSELKKQEVLEQHISKTKGTLLRIDDDILKNANERFQLGLQIAENARLQTDLAAELQSTSDYRERAIIEERIHKAKIQGSLIAKKNLKSEETQNALLQERESVGKRLIKQQDAYEDSVRKAELFADNLNAAKKQRLELEGVSVNLEEDLKKTQKDRMGIEERLGQMVAQRTALQEDTKKREYRLNNLHEERAKLLEKINKLQAQLNLLKLIQMAYERFVALDKAAEDFRRTTGFTVDQMGHIRKYAEEINIKFRDMGVTIEQAYKSAEVLSNVFGRASLISKDAMMNVSLLSQNLGVAEEVSAQVLENFMGIGKSSEAAAFDTIKLGAVLSDKTGVPFAKVMDDVAKASETTINMIGGSPAKLMKAAIAARALGLDINKIASSQRKLLDFTSSIRVFLSKKRVNLHLKERQTKH